MGKISNNWERFHCLNEEIDTLNIPIKVEGFSSGVGVNVGNPHVVFFGKDIDKINLTKLVQQSKIINFFQIKQMLNLLKLIILKKIKMKVWERGAGMTLACGSGACAAVYAGQKKIN